MRQYELTYLISDNIPESDLNKVTGKVLGYIKDADGKLLKEEIWGRRKLAYPIKKLEFATYITTNFEMPSEKAKEFEHNIYMTSKIVRHLLIVKDFGAQELTLTSEDIAETEDIEEAVGGEKSFEVVVGETDESKDLMSVRSEAASEMDHEQNKPLTESNVTSDDKIENASEEMKEPEVVENAEIKEVKPAKKVQPTVDQPKAEKADIDKTVEKVKPEKDEIKPIKKIKTAPKKVKNEDNEADRLSKLDKELDDILGEDL